MATSTPSRDNKLCSSVYKRKHKKTILLNDRELKALNNYCSQYKVKNQSKFLRDSVFYNIMKTWDDDYPTLWDKKVMAQLIQY